MSSSTTPPPPSIEEMHPKLPQLITTALLILYASTRRKLTPAGAAAGGICAAIHILDPSPIPFVLLVTFFLSGTIVTRIGREAKKQITSHHITSTPSPRVGDGEKRSATQVFCNAGFACLLSLLHVWGGWDLLVLGIVVHYAAVASDTFSSELGILAVQTPVLITSLKRVPRGTNGGVTLLGLGFGVLGSALIVGVAVLGEGGRVGLGTGVYVILMGALGSVIDSVLGATVQSTAVDERGKVIEGFGGVTVRFEGGKTLGRDLLSNNGVNFAMAVATSVFAMTGAWALELTWTA
ncbi:hypothetical protein K470DRAFT_257320 [Piedraia hortae CBS 480.64]|uniref:DUF92-domain-containing protein n=1 Tax=Piedraia hortae CBS 480.64 TaxID=1314780 RepID=A0A6A7C2N8_9PEZI|nr:hypothetical protein K470DRAFT_257320 [Piedraia hortae CBS 480.64]